jgi:hypothetical protein
MATGRYTPPAATSPRIAARSRRSLVALEKRIAAAVEALVAAERAGEAALYRADGLVGDLARSLRLAKAALAEVRNRVAELGATREGG